MPKRRSKEESEWLGMVKSVPCVLCARLGQTQELNTEAHHPRQWVGGGQREDDYLAIALCGGYQAGCHSSRIGVHGDKSLLRIAKVEEKDLLADTVRAVHRVLRQS